jgi:hypothetical protein
MENHTGQANLAEERVAVRNSVSGATVPSAEHVFPGAPQCKVFRNMENLRSDELSISFVGDKVESGLGQNNMLEISARNESRRVALGELDLIDNRTGQLNGQGAVLLGLTWKMKTPHTTPNQKKVSRLRGVMRNSLGIKDNPFNVSSSSSGGWLPRFQIKDARGLADERAKQQAGRRTASNDKLINGLPAQSTDPCEPEYTYESEDDDTENWIKKNSPDPEV